MHHANPKRVGHVNIAILVHSNAVYRGEVSGTGFGAVLRNGRAAGAGEGRDAWTAGRAGQDCRTHDREDQNASRCDDHQRAGQPQPPWLNSGLAGGTGGRFGRRRGRGRSQAGGVRCDPSSNLRPRLEAEFVANLLDMTLGGPLRDEEALGDVTVAQALSNECRDLAFAPG